MIKIKNASTVDRKIIDIDIKSDESVEVDASGLTLLPALIDPHVHFRTPGAEHKENWISASKAAISGGITSVIDMPNNIPSCTTIRSLAEKRALIDKQLAEAGIPLRYYLYLGADRQNLQEISLASDHAVGIKVFMGSSTGDLLIDDEDSLRTIFQTAARHDLLVSVHAEDEETVRRNARKFASGENAPSTHSMIRSREAAVKATSRAISLAKEYGTRLCILHVSTKEEIALIAEAKDTYHRVYGEAAPHHLFFNTDAYQAWGTKVQVNPPLRDSADQEALWAALNDGTIDFVGTDHAPHTLAEKSLPYGKAPSGIPSVELLLPLMLDAVDRRLTTLSRLIQVTRKNIERIFRLPPNDDLVLVDLNVVKEVRDEDLKTLCGWSPYAGKRLRGWPVCTVANGKIFYNAEFSSCMTVNK